MFSVINRPVSGVKIFTVDDGSASTTPGNNIIFGLDVSDTGATLSRECKGDLVGTIISSP
ncbi:MAG: hypothetical protein NVSMB40_05040 [Aquirhabdus sp.]